MVYASLCVIPPCLIFVFRRFGTLCLFHLHRQVGMTVLHMKMEQCSETSAHKVQTPGNYPEESMQHVGYCYRHGVSNATRYSVSQ